MKNLILITGTIGVGKSNISLLLARMIEPAAYLDGDWCWQVYPKEENQMAALDSVVGVLNNYLKQDGIDNIILDWTIYDEELINTLVARLDSAPFKLHKFCLTCDEDVLRSRLVYDITAGRRDASVVADSLMKLPLFAALNCQHIQVTVENDLDVVHQIIDAMKLA